MGVRSNLTRPLKRVSSCARGHVVEDGFTLVEVLVAAVITGIALSAVSWTMQTAAKASSIMREDPMAYLLAREIRELADVLPREPSGAVSVTRAADILALDSLQGAVFSPPVRADRTTAGSLSGWAQRVTLVVCGLDASRTPTGESATLGLSRDARRLYRLSVSITYVGQEVDHFDWWLTP